MALFKRRKKSFDELSNELYELRREIQYARDQLKAATDDRDRAQILSVIEGYDTQQKRLMREIKKLREARTAPSLARGAGRFTARAGSTVRGAGVALSGAHRQVKGVVGGGLAKAESAVRGPAVAVKEKAVSVWDSPRIEGKYAGAIIGGIVGFILGWFL